MAKHQICFLCSQASINGCSRKPAARQGRSAGRRTRTSKHLLSLVTNPSWRKIRTNSLLSWTWSEVNRCPLSPTPTRLRETGSEVGGSFRTSGDAGPAQHLSSSVHEDLPPVQRHLWVHSACTQRCAVAAHGRAVKIIIS